MWGIIIGGFVVLNVISTAIVLCACVVSGRQSRQILDSDHAQVDEQLELASAIAKLRHVEPAIVTAQA